MCRCGSNCVRRWRRWRRLCARVPAAGRWRSTPRNMASPRARRRCFTPPRTTRCWAAAGSGRLKRHRRDQAAGRGNPRPRSSVWPWLIAAVCRRSLDVPIHLRQHAVVQHLAGFGGQAAVLLVNRPGEGMEFTADDLCLGGFGHRFHIARHVGVGGHRDHARFHAVPDVLAAPGAVEHGLGAGHK